MQKLFVIFPDGAPGLGLLLLRIAASAGLIALPSRLGTNAWIGLLLVTLVTIPLLIGFMTTLTALAAAVLESAFALSGELHAPLIEISTIAQLLSLALVGPGAYSLDSRLFGRRRLIFESRKPEDLD